MVKREAVEQIGLMDESFFMYSEETDWCYRLHKAGWEVWVDPRAEIVHLGGQSSALARVESESRLMESKLRFFSKHRGRRHAIALGIMLALCGSVKSAARCLRGLTASSLAGRT